MPPVLALSLRTAVLRIGGTILQTLRAEYPDEQVELRGVPLPTDTPAYRCYVNGIAVGPLLQMENVVGTAIFEGLAEAEQRLAQEISDAVMMHLQTQG